MRRTDVGGRRGGTAARAVVLAALVALSTVVAGGQSSRRVRERPGRARSRGRRAGCSSTAISRPSTGNRRTRARRGVALPSRTRRPRRQCRPRRTTPTPPGPRTRGQPGESHRVERRPRPCDGRPAGAATRAAERDRVPEPHPDRHRRRLGRRRLRRRSRRGVRVERPGRAVRPRERFLGPGRHGRLLDGHGDVRPDRTGRLRPDERRPRGPDGLRFRHQRTGRLPRRGHPPVRAVVAARIDPPASTPIGPQAIDRPRRRPVAAGVVETSTTTVSESP